AASELPTVAELGFAGMTVMGSIGLLTPAGTPSVIIEQIAQATRTIVAELALTQMLSGAGIEPTLNSVPKNSGSRLRPMLLCGLQSWKRSGLRSIERIRANSINSVPRTRTLVRHRRARRPWHVHVPTEIAARLRCAAQQN